MSAAENYEVLIVGGGKAGKSLAADLGRAGQRVALVERGMIGGTCINVGCIPSKAFITSARVAHLVARAGEYGVQCDGSKTLMRDVLAYKRSVVDGMIDLNWHNLHGALGEHFILGRARFVAPRTIAVRPNDNGPERLLVGEKVFINLGAEPACPGVPGLADLRPLTSTSALNLESLPGHLIVLGGGYIGVELGQAFRRLGSRVTIVQRRPHLLPAEDLDISEAVAEFLREDGIDVRLSTEVVAASGRSGDRVMLHVNDGFGERTIDGTDVLVAVGRVPMTGDVGLDSAGVELESQGFIRVNDRLETTAPRTSALGDCAGSPQLTHVAFDDYRIVKSNVFAGGKRTTADRLIPHTVFIEPEVGRVGLTERDAKRRNVPIRVAKVPTSVVPRARTLGETRGFMKAIVDADSDQILGFGMLGAGAGEVTAVVQTAMLARLPFNAVRDSVFAHPTMAEGLNYLFSAPMK